MGVNSNMGRTDSRIKAINDIDARVAVMEKANDAYMAKHGTMSYTVYNAIQNLMDERDRLYRESHSR